MKQQPCAKYLEIIFHSLPRALYQTLNRLRSVRTRASSPIAVH